MFITDYIKVYENALPPDLCAAIIKRFDECETVKEEREMSEIEGKEPLLVRSHTELDISHEPGFEDIQQVMMKITELAVTKYQSELPIRTFPKDIGVESFRVKKYRAGEEDYFAYHVDVNSHSSARRYLALIWYLNDVEQGGDTYFPHPNVRIKPKQGRLAMFPSLWMYPHSGEKAVSNDKYILITYLHYL